jgi:hypothetical protein
MRLSRSRKPGCDAGQATVALVGRARHVDCGLQRIREALEAAVVAAGLGQFEQPPLGILDLLLWRHIDRRVEGDVDHVLADGDQRPARREVVDGAAVVGRVDDGHRLGRKLGEVVGHRHVAHLRVAGQEGLDRHRIGDLAHPDQFGRHLEDLAMQGVMEVLGFQEVRHPVEGVVVDEDRAEQCLLGLDVVRRFPVERRFRLPELACCLGHSRPDSRFRWRPRPGATATL